MATANTPARYDRISGDYRKYQARIKDDRWGMLFDEFTAAGWRPCKVSKRTGRPDKNGIWVMRFTGIESSAAVRLARRCGTVSLSSRALRPGERG